MSSIEDAVNKSVKHVIDKMGTGQYDGDIDKVNEERRRLGMNELGRSLDEEADGAPACDACGTEGTGSLQCGRCHAVFYCNPDCQLNDWKGGHKLQCATMKAEVEATGKQVVEHMSDTSLPVIIRCQGMEEIDGSGAYRAAVREGLHQAIKDLFQVDLDDCLDLYRRDDPTTAFATQFIMSTIFRGQRREGKGQKTGGNFRCIDGQRVYAYVKSDSDAFDVWFNASLQVYRTALDDQVYFNDRATQQQARNGARDVFAAWIYVFVNKRATKRILMPNGVPDEAAVERATSIALRIKDLLRDRWDAPCGDAKDPNSSLEGTLNQIAAQVSYWCRKLDIPVDFEVLLDLDQAHLEMYLGMAKPLGEATIAKGFSLTNEEARVAMSAALATRQPKVNPKKRGGKKNRRRGR